jgi:hypothetical protein
MLPSSKLFSEFVPVIGAELVLLNAPMLAAPLSSELPAEK